MTTPIDPAKSIAELKRESTAEADRGGEGNGLWCDHCGGIAIEGDKFTDGQGGACVTCGFPGAVSCDAETDPWWNTSELDDARCSRAGCSECEELKREGEGGKGERCPGCGGTGWLYPEDPNAPDKYMPDRDCPGCKGSGRKAREGSE